MRSARRMVWTHYPIASSNSMMILRNDPSLSHYLSLSPSLAFTLCFETEIVFRIEPDFQSIILLAQPKLIFVRTKMFQLQANAHSHYRIYADLKRKRSYRRLLCRWALCTHCGSMMRNVGCNLFIFHFCSHLRTIEGDPMHLSVFIWTTLAFIRCKRKQLNQITALIPFRPTIFRSLVCFTIYQNLVSVLLLLLLLAFHNWTDTGKERNTRPHRNDK